MNKVEICGVNTSKLPVLSHERMRQLLQQMHAGDEQARNELVQGNLRLVLSIIQRFNNRGELVDDLFQVGCIGLMKAIDNFDLSQNVRFSTYAVPMIIGGDTALSAGQQSDSGQSILARCGLQSTSGA